MKLWKKIAAGVLCLALAAGTAATLVGCGGSESEAAARMQVDVNPSVEFILDKDNKVLSVTALNDDGSLIIAGEAFVGKTAEDALELMLDISVETGYLVKGEASIGADAVTIGITADGQAAQELYDEIKASAETFLSENGIQAAVQKGEELSLAALKALAMEADPTLSEEEAAAMNAEQLLNVLKIARIETAQLITEELREAYTAVKAYEFDFAQRQATKDIIDGLGGAYESFLNAYAAALDSYRTAMQTVEQAKYDYLVSADSAYQQALEKVREQKDIVLAKRKEVAQLSDGAAKEAAKTVLAAEEAALETKQGLLDLAGESAEAAFDLALTAMETIEKTLTELEKTFPSEITSALQEGAQDVQDAMNGAKSEAFAKFEQAHKEDIEQALADLQARKQALIDANRV